MNTTYYIASGRETKEKIKRQYYRILAADYLQEFINALPNIVTVLNDKRQIVFSNNALMEQMSEADFRALLGKRPGEAVKCIHSDECSNGCGTSESCKVCGALSAILISANENRHVSKECTITTRKNDEETSLDFEATASPFVLEGEKYTIFSLTDISSTKRRRMLERIFFHDILNTAGNIRGIAEIMPGIDNPEKSEILLRLLKNVSNELVEEILAQKDLVSAEAGELKPKYEPVFSAEILNTLAGQFAESPGRKKHSILIDEHCEDIRFICDRSLLIRILKNMLKNALEATTINGEVLLSARKKDGYALFSVHNNSYMPRKVQLQVFRRNFSTKGSERGLGTYSMRLLGEKYLKGKVFFETGETSGTTFYLKVPLKNG